MSYSGDMEGCHARARTTDNGRRTTEHEDSARILEAEFAKYIVVVPSPIQSGDIIY